MATVTIRGKGTRSASIDALTDRQVLNRLRKIAELEQIAKDADAQIKAIRAELTGGNVIACDTEKYAFSYKDETRNVIDTARLKNDLPDIAAAYLKPSTRRVFRYKLYV